MYVNIPFKFDNNLANTFDVTMLPFIIVKTQKLKKDAFLNNMENLLVKKFMWLNI